MANELVARYGILSLGDISVQGAVSASTDVNITQNLLVGGNASIDGDTTLGASSADNVVFEASVSSSLIPAVNDTFDLGTGLLRWGGIYAGTLDLTGNLSISGSALIWGDLEVLGTTTTIHTDDLYIKDIHVVIADGAATSLAADGGGLYISGADVNFAWSHSGQHMTLNVPLSGSFTGNAANLTGYTWANIASKPAVVSSSVQIDHDSTTGFVANEHIDHSGVSILAGDGMSGGGTIASTRTLTLDTGSAHFQNAIASAAVEVPPGTVSSSVQVDHDLTTNFTASEHFEQADITTVGTVTAGSVAAILPAGTVSGSSQVSFTTISDKPALVSGSAQISYTGITDVPVGIVSGSSQIDHDATTNFTSDEHFTQANITTVGTVTTGSVTAILPAGSISSSAQVDLSSATGTAANATSASYATTASYAENVSTPSLQDVTDTGATTTTFVTLSSGASIAGVLYSTASNPDVDTGTEVVGTVPTGSYDGAFFDYVVKNGVNLRAGTVTSIWEAGTTNVEYTDVSTQDIGDTTGVDFSVDLVSDTARLKLTVPSLNWIVKAIVRAI